MSYSTSEMGSPRPVARGGRHALVGVPTPAHGRPADVEGPAALSASGQIGFGRRPSGALRSAGGVTRGGGIIVIIQVLPSGK